MLGGGVVGELRSLNGTHSNRIVPRLSIRTPIMRRIDDSWRKRGVRLSLVFILCTGGMAAAADPPPLAGPTPQSKESTLAVTPPMGWNSWDGYGTPVKKADVKANTQWLAEHLKPFGWEYVVVDMEWFVTNPIAEGNSKTFTYVLDANGRYLPAENRFPSSSGGKGFNPVADYIHSLGLKFGIHILRGIPKKALEADLPIAGSSFHAS